MVVGEKTRLRPIERDDLPRFVKWFGDPEVRRHLALYAIRTLLGLAFYRMNLHRVILRVDADNGRGIRCYEKVGFRREGTLREAVFKDGMYCRSDYLTSRFSPSLIC